MLPFPAVRLHALAVEAFLHEHAGILRADVLTTTTSRKRTDGGSHSALEGGWRRAATINFRVHARANAVGIFPIHSAPSVGRAITLREHRSAARDAKDANRMDECGLASRSFSLGLRSRFKSGDPALCSLQLYALTFTPPPPPPPL